MADRVPPHLYFVVSAVFHYLGPAFAVLLFARVDVLGVAWLRIASAALVFALWRRPWRAFARLDRSGRRLLVAWGAVLAVMNACFYLAIDRLPLGTVAAIEFLPVIALAALGARTAAQRRGARDGRAGRLHAHRRPARRRAARRRLGVRQRRPVRAYIVLAHRVARYDALSGIDGLAASMLIAAVVVTPIGGWEVLPALTDPVALLAGVGVGVCSSVIPYVSDQLAMRRLPRATYALMVSLLPATATVIGVVVLAQIPVERPSSPASRSSSRASRSTASHRSRPAKRSSGTSRAAGRASAHAAGAGRTPKQPAEHQRDQDRVVELTGRGMKPARGRTGTRQ